MTCLPGPAYLSLGAREVAARAEMALGLLGPDRCTVCPRLCKVNRLADQRGLCAIGRQAIVASHFPHFGEENCLRGWNGSGTIFFSGCNLRCVFCQNFDISSQVHSEPVSRGPPRMARSGRGADAAAMRSKAPQDVRRVKRPALMLRPASPASV